MTGAELRALAFLAEDPYAFDVLEQIGEVDRDDDNSNDESEGCA